MKLKHQCCCGGEECCHCPVVPDEILVNTGVNVEGVPHLVNADEPAPTIIDSQGNSFVPFTGCGNIPSSFIMQRRPTTFAGCQWIWTGPGGFQYRPNGFFDPAYTYHPPSYNVKFVSVLLLRPETAVLGYSCRSEFWFGLVRSAVLIDDNLDWLQHQSGRWPIYRTLSNSEFAGAMTFPGHMEVDTHGNIDLSFDCGHGGMRYFSEDSYGLSYIAGHGQTLGGGPGDATWERIQTRQQFIDDAANILEPLCLGVDTKTITFEPVP